jgi:hypothetical protein
MRQHRPQNRPAIAFATHDAPHLSCQHNTTCCNMMWVWIKYYCELHNNRPKTAETSGQLENRKNGFETRRGSNFRPVWLEPSRFLSRSVEKRCDQSRFKCRKIVNYYAIGSTTYRQSRDAEGMLLSGSATSIEVVSPNDDLWCVATGRPQSS